MYDGVPLWKRWRYGSQSRLSRERKGKKILFKMRRELQTIQPRCNEYFRLESSAITMFRSFPGLLCKYARVGFTFQENFDRWSLLTIFKWNFEREREIRVERMILLFKKIFIFLAWNYYSIWKWFDERYYQSWIWNNRKDEKMIKYLNDNGGFYF